MQENGFEKAILYLENKLKNNNSDSLATVINEIEKEYTKDSLHFCFEHILKTKNDTKILDSAIRLMNTFFDKKNLSILIDFILRPVNDNSFTNLKVLAIKTIPKYNDKSAVSALLYCLNDKNSNYKIKFSIADALGKIGDINAFETLAKFATDEKDESAYIKESAVAALGMLGDERAIDVFSSIMETKQIFKEKFSFLKEKIMEAMSKLDISKNKSALSILKKSLYDNSPSVRIAAIETLMNSELKESYELILETYKLDDDIEVKKNALVALFNISCDIKILEEAIKNSDNKELREFAINTIKEIEESE